MATFALMTLGCKVNAYESECYAQGLKDLGYIEAKEGEVADIYIINTCMVTNTAAQKSRQKIHQAKRLNPEALICVVGCMVQIDTNVEEADVLIGCSHKSELVLSVDKSFKTKERIVLVDDVNKKLPFENLTMNSFTHQTRAFLKIEDGCNQFCAYCTIPLARGRERSMDYDEVMCVAKKLKENGHKEIVLTGIHTGRYNDGSHKLIDVLKGLLDIGIERIRISSIEITEITNEIIELFKNEPRLARHLHIPLQAGSNKILKAMNRPYENDYFVEKIAYIKENIPDIAIGTDVIVGFPSETDEDFQVSKEILEKAGIVYFHVFPYSLRDNTVAARMKEQIKNEVKKARVKDLIAQGEKQKLAYFESLVNKKQEALFERKVNGYWCGHTSTYVPVKVKSDLQLKGQMTTVVIDSIENDECIAHLSEA